MTYVIDRIEDGIAVLECMETQEIIEIPQDRLPRGCREGQLLQKDGEAYTIDHAATNKRKENMQSRLDAILKKGKKNF